jgi:hypothetical protein
MPNSITLIKGPGGLGRPLDGEDYISGYLHYTSANLPSGFTTSNTAGRVKQVFSISEAESLGITDEHIGEVSSTASFTITGAGSVGNTIDLYVGSTNIGSYTIDVSDTVNTITYGLASAINAGTSGYTSNGTTASAVQVITSPEGLGISTNALTFTPVIGGTVSATYSAFAGGVASEIDIIHYHVSEYFRAQPKGNLYVGIYPVSSDFAEITTIQNYANGSIRQIGIYTKEAFDISDLGLVQTQLDLCYDNYKPLEAVYQADFSAVSDLSTLTNLHTLSAENVSVCLGQDGAAIGEALWTATGKSIGTVGITLGAISLSKVNESIAWVAKFNMASTELDTLAFANGDLYTDLSDGFINNLDNKGYVFLKKHIGISGSYFDNPYTAVAVTSDYARVNNNRTINKAVRSLRTFLLPQLASPLKVNADGTLTQDVISYFETLGARALDVMVRNAELSAYSVDINPAQNVLSTSTLTINVSLVPIGTADKIVVNVGFVTSI